MNNCRNTYEIIREKIELDHNEVQEIVERREQGQEIPTIDQIEIKKSICQRLEETSTKWSSEIKNELKWLNKIKIEDLLQKLCSTEAMKKLKD